MGGQLPEEMMFEPGIKPLGIGAPLKQHWSDQPLPTFTRQQTRTWPRLATPFSRHLLASARPAMGAVCRWLKPTFIQIDHLRGPLGREDLSKFLKIDPTLGRVPFSVSKSFFYASPAAAEGHTRWH